MNFYHDHVPFVTSMKMGVLFSWSAKEWGSVERDNLKFRKDEDQDILQKAKELAQIFQKRAQEIDRTASFPRENFNDLKKSGFLSLTVPRQYGGREITLETLLNVIETLACGDAATALCLGWHLGVVMDLAERREWPKEQFAKLCQDIVAKGSLVNRAATEPATGSPVRGGKPETTAVREGNLWVLNGRKTFTTMAPGLDYAIVTASLEKSEDVCGFLVPLNRDGVRIEAVWDTLGMRGTRSDDLILQNVKLPEEAKVEYFERNRKPSPAGWLLHIPACYLGIAVAARNEAVQFARTYQPNSLPHPIQEVGHIRDKIGRIDLKLMKARTFLYYTARRWDEENEERSSLGLELSAAKTIVTNAAVEIVDLAMRVVGGRSLSKTNALERHYRDVRAGLHNPPSDDATIELFAKNAFHE